MSQNITIKDAIEEIILDLEATIIEYNDIVEEIEPPKFSDDTLRAATCIFTAVLMDKMWDLQEGEDLDIEDRLNMASKAGQEIRRLIKTYTGIDSHDLC
jgi:hypothetical protein